ncbi:MAG: Hsp20/alpha crystallin family protein [Myxococcaceae bacterium]|nr:Hsp20/alpha crystallin family protein [Myxococcaceae bacterium]
MTFDVDEHIARIERLYRQITGQDPVRRDVPLAPLPADVNPFEHVTENLRRLEWIIEQLERRSVPLTHTQPRITVFEDEREWSCATELPGVRREDVKIELTRGVLRISGHRPDPADTRDGRRPVYSEASSGHFERTVPTPPYLDETSLEAKLADGVLMVRCRKRPVEATRRVEIEVA